MESFDGASNFIREEIHNIMIRFCRAIINFVLPVDVMRKIKVTFAANNRSHILPSSIVNKYECAAKGEDYHFLSFLSQVREMELE